MAAALSVFAGGFLSALTLIAVLQRRTRSVSPSPRESVSLRLRPVRRSRVAAVEQRVDLLERAAASGALSVASRARPQRPQRPIADPEAVAALLALGYRRSEAVARLAAVSEATTTTEDRIRAALRTP
jgi:hypothetical protein